MNILGTCEHSRYFDCVIVQALNRELKELKQQIQGLLEEGDSFGTENHDLTKKKAKLELDIKDIEDEVEGNQSMKVVMNLPLFSNRACRGD